MVSNNRCLSTYSGCNNKAKFIKLINSNNFCSIPCYQLYTGQKKPSIPTRKIFDNPERQQLHDLYRWALGAEKPDWVKQKETRPSPDEWIVVLSGNAIYIWDDFDKRYVRYILRIGMVSDL